MRAAVDGALRKLRSSRSARATSIAAVVDSLRIDDRLDPIKAADALRNAVERGPRHVRAAGRRTTPVGDAAVLRLGDGAETVLAYFRGAGPPPVEYETGVTTPADDASPSG